MSTVSTLYLLSQGGIGEARLDAFCSMCQGTGLLQLAVWHKKNQGNP